MPGTVADADNAVVNETSKVTAPWSWQSQVDLRLFCVFHEMWWVYSRRCVRSCPDYSQARWFTRRTPRDKHTVLLLFVIFFSERIYNKASLRIRYMGRNLEETRRKSPRVLSKRTYLFPQQEAWQHMGKVVYPGISLETQDPGFLLRASHIGTIYLPDICQNSRYPEGEWIGIRHEPPCLFRIV